MINHVPFSSNCFRFSSGITQRHDEKSIAQQLLERRQTVLKSSEYRLQHSVASLFNSSVVPGVQTGQLLQLVMELSLQRAEQAGKEVQNYAKAKAQYKALSKQVRKQTPAPEKPQSQPPLTLDDVARHFAPPERAAVLEKLQQLEEQGLVELSYSGKKSKLVSLANPIIGVSPKAAAALAKPSLLLDA